MKPVELLSLILQKKALNLNTKREQVSDYILKVCGQEEYLLGDYPLIRYAYIQDAISRDIIPTLVAVSIDCVNSKCKILLCQFQGSFLLEWVHLVYELVSIWNGVLLVKGFQ